MVGICFVSYSTEVVLFYADGCSHCARIERLLEKIEYDYPELEVVRYRITDPDRHDLLSQLLSAYEAELGGVPIVFVGNTAMVSDTFYDPSQSPITLAGRACELKLEQLIIEAVNGGALSPLAKVKEDSSVVLSKKVTIPALVLAAAADSVNPCTFAVLVLLLGALLVAGRKGKMLKAGLAFISGIYVSYLLMGIGIFSAIQAAGIQRPFIIVVSCFAMLVGLWNVKDYFAYGKWFTIEVPNRWRPLVKRITSSAVSVPGFFAIGVLDSLFLLPCSSGPYIAILAMLSKATTRSHGVGLLFLYNLIFILPLLIIVFAVNYGYTTTARAERWRSARLGKLHLISGISMFLLGAGMIVALQLGYM
jgi:cytochrome c biogenesis protein CcdA/glutaredoxin